MSRNVTPSVARVHGYLLVDGGTLTERDIREALGLSHYPVRVSNQGIEQ